MADCPSCGAALPPDAPAGLCPLCLARGASPAGSGATSLPPDPAAEEELRHSFHAHVPEIELGACIGRGGMGLVFRARQKRLDREVAVKVLDPGLARDGLFAERFTREAQALARLAHPHIVAVHDYGRAGELFYLVLEYVDGVNLRAVLQARTLAPQQALAIVPQLCEALEFAHAHGVVHRDVKPENILLDRLGRVKIADFGLAKLLGVDGPPGTLTSSGQVLGTLRYMAPEQIDRPLAVDHRADIYSLGVVFYEMLTGEIPMGRFAPPSHKVRIDVQLDQVVLRTLEREPELRYQHVSEVKSDVEAIGAGERLAGRAGEPGATRELSWLALVAPAVAFGVPVLASMGLVLLILDSRPILSDAPWSGDGFHRSLSVRPHVFTAFASLLGMALGCALGWLALERIRARWPRLYGLGAALTGFWFLPLAALIQALVAGSYFGLEALGVTLPSWVLGLEAALGLALGVAFVVRRRRRLLGELDAARAA